jgi:putative membrane protein
MFGAFDDGWTYACGVVLLSGAVAVGLMAIFGKWKKVVLPDYRPTIQV